MVEFFFLKKKVSFLLSAHKIFSEITSQLWTSVLSLIAEMKLTFQSCQGDSTIKQILTLYMDGVIFPASHRIVTG